jgi:hypothetical protein
MIVKVVEQIQEVCVGAEQNAIIDQDMKGLLLAGDDETYA